jgi:hypothetical protein
MGESTLSHFPCHGFALPDRICLRTPPESPSASLGFYLNGDNNLALHKDNSPIPGRDFAKNILPGHLDMIVERWTW